MIANGYTERTKQSGGEFTESYLRAMASDLPSFSESLVTGLFIFVDAMEQRNLDYAFIDGLASGYRSHARFTQDVDFLLQVPQMVLPELLDDLASKGFEFDLETTIRQWVQDHMTALTYQQVQVDWLKPVLPVFQHVIDTAQQEEWLGHKVRIATAESLIVTKLVAFRRQDQLDIENLLAANQGQLDLDLVRCEMESIAELDDPRLVQFEEMVNQFYSES